MEGRKELSPLQDPPQLTSFQAFLSPQIVPASRFLRLILAGLGCHPLHAWIHQVDYVSMSCWVQNLFGPQSSVTYLE